MPELRNERQVVSGSLVRGVRRKPKRHAEGRVCAKSACTTKISVYNKTEFCNPHKPFKAPRVRGRVPAGTRRGKVVQEP